MRTTTKNREDLDVIKKLCHKIYLLEIMLEGNINILFMATVIKKSCTVGRLLLTEF